MWKYVKFLFLLPFLLVAQDLEVRLATRSPLKGAYLSGFGEHEAWREVLEFDLNAGGFCSVLEQRDDLEVALNEQFNLSFWKKKGISYCLSANLAHDQLILTVFNVEKGTTKTYPATSLDRRAIHRLSDAIHKDLFGVEGIASLRLIYTQRMKNGSSKGLDWLSEVWVCDSDGANAKQLTFEKSYCLTPYFLPYRDGQFCYVCEKSGQSKIYRSSLASPKSELFVDLRGNQALPGVMKNGLQIAFITDVAGRPDLFVQNLSPTGKMAGKARQLFSAARATQATPTYSPDGKQIAFVSDKDGPPRIYVMSTAVSRKMQTPRLLTKKNRENTSPAWSPDGMKLAYSAKIDGIRQIWIYDFANEEEVQITEGPSNKENPSWAPDSFHLVYNTESDERCELFLIHLNQGDPIAIHQGIGQNRFASWEPR